MLLFGENIGTTFLVLFEKKISTNPKTTDIINVRFLANSTDNWNKASTYNTNPSSTETSIALYKYVKYFTVKSCPQLVDRAVGEGTRHTLLVAISLNAAFLFSLNAAFLFFTECSIFFFHWMQHSFLSCRILPWVILLSKCSSSSMLDKRNKQHNYVS